jgi:hypothetical protein
MGRPALAETRTLVALCGPGHGYRAVFAGRARGPGRGEAGSGAILCGVSAGKSDEPGVLGNLPRSRPGVRSDKRRGANGGAAGDGATAASAAAGPAETSPARRPKAPHPKTTARAKSSGGSSRPTEPAREPEARPDSQRHDPLTDAVRLAGKVAETGLKTVSGLLKRLPGR